ncbi:MAG: CDP-glucose 4,6-dehydratase [Bacteroidota bacterium]
MNNYQIILNAFRNKKVFLTGHTGFKGSWMLAILKLLSAQVKGYALEPEEEPSMFNLINGESLCNSIIADIRDREKLEKELLDFQPDFIFHFAAQSLVRMSYQLPVETFEVNMLGTAKLLDAARKLEKPCNIIIITTDKVYENKEMDYAYKEDDKLGGFDPYSSSKACAEIVTASYRLSFFNPGDYDSHLKSIATARSGNVIGGGDWAKDRIVPDIVRSLNAVEPLKVRNPKATRPWQYVLEPLSGYLFLGAKMQENPVGFADSYNFGPYPDDELSVEELVKISLDHWGSGVYEKANSHDEPHEAGLLKLDITKALNKLGWKPKLKSREAIAKTVNWYRNYHQNPLEYTERQVKEYFEL